MKQENPHLFYLIYPAQLPDTPCAFPSPALYLYPCIFSIKSTLLLSSICFNTAAMGNCLANNKILAQDDHENYSDEQAKVEKMKTSSSTKFEASPRKEKCMKKHKKVRFEIQNDEEVDRGSDGNSRSVRIRVVMTQEELKKMLSSKDENDNTTLEQLLGIMKLRGGKICKRDLGVCSWRPALESIPEDRLIK